MATPPQRVVTTKRGEEAVQEAMFTDLKAFFGAVGGDYQEDLFTDQKASTGAVGRDRDAMIANLQASLLQ